MAIGKIRCNNQKIRPRKNLLYKEVLVLKILTISERNWTKTCQWNGNIWNVWSLPQNCRHFTTEISFQYKRIKNTFSLFKLIKLSLWWNHFQCYKEFFLIFKPPFILYFWVVFKGKSFSRRHNDTYSYLSF